MSLCFIYSNHVRNNSKDCHKKAGSEAFRHSSPNCKLPCSVCLVQGSPISVLERHCPCRV